MTTLAQVVEALRVRLDTIDGLRVYDHVPADTATGDSAFIAPPEIDYRDSAGVDAAYLFDILLFTPAVDHKRSQHALIPYMERTGPRSIFEAIETQRDLGLDDVDAHVRANRPPRLEEIAAFQAFGGAVTVVVSITGT